MHEQDYRWQRREQRAQKRKACMRVHGLRYVRLAQQEIAKGAGSPPAAESRVPRPPAAQPTANRRGR